MRNIINTWYKGLVIKVHYFNLTNKHWMPNIALFWYASIEKLYSIKITITYGVAILIKNNKQIFCKGYFH